MDIYTHLTRWITFTDDFIGQLSQNPSFRLSFSVEH